MTELKGRRLEPLWWWIVCSGPSSGASSVCWPGVACWTISEVRTPTPGREEAPVLAVAAASEQGRRALGEQLADRDKTGYARKVGLTQETDFVLAGLEFGAVRPMPGGTCRPDFRLCAAAREPEDRCPI